MKFLAIRLLPLCRSFEERWVSMGAVTGAIFGGDMIA